MATIFKKIKFETHENIGSGPIHLPEEELHTITWISLNNETIDFGEERFEQGMLGVSHAMKHIAPLFVMCDPQDIHVVPQVKASHNEKPTIFFYDRYPGGIGLSEKIYDGMRRLLKKQKIWFQTVRVSMAVRLVSDQTHSKKQLKRIRYGYYHCFSQLLFHR